MRIGKQFREISKIPMQYKIGYQVHLKAMMHRLDNETFFAV